MSSDAIEPQFDAMGERLRGYTAEVPTAQVGEPSESTTCKGPP